MNSIDLKTYFSSVLNVPANIVYRFYKNEIDKDIDCYMINCNSFINSSRRLQFHYLLYSCKTFRNVLYYRMRHSHKVVISEILCKLIVRPVDTVELEGKFGPGLFIAHKVCVLVPESAGCNLTVMGGVTIGVNKGKNPIIGDNVYIGANASVVGGIRIGDNVKIGAGAVVLKDIPDDCVAVGNPARIISSKDLTSSDLLQPQGGMPIKLTLDSKKVGLAEARSKLDQ